MRRTTIIRDAQAVASDRYVGRNTRKLHGIALDHVAFTGRRFTDEGRTAERR